MPRHRDEEPEIRLRPPKPKVRNEGVMWAIAVNRMMHYARISRNRGGKNRGGSSPALNPERACFQRCAVRVSYSSNATAGQWRAHGRYVARERATVWRGSEVCRVRR